jgi:hypothetical protein
MDRLKKISSPPGAVSFDAPAVISSYIAVRKVGANGQETAPNGHTSYSEVNSV